MSTRTAAMFAMFLFGNLALGADLRENELLIGGGSSQADGIKVSGPNIYLRRNAPCVAAAMVQTPGMKARYAYVVLVSGDERRQLPARYESKSGVTESRANSVGFVEIANKKVAFDYQIEVDPSGKRAPKETLAINGAFLDLGKGRTVLVNVVGREMRVIQSQAKLPGAPSWETGTAKVETQATFLLNHLRRGGKEFRDFLK